MSEPIYGKATTVKKDETKTFEKGIWPLEVYEYTQAAWIYLRDDGIYNFIMAMGHQSMYVHTDGSLYAGNHGTAVYTKDNPINYNTWTHVAVTSSKSDSSKSDNKSSISFYINGKKHEAAKDSLLDPVEDINELVIGGTRNEHHKFEGVIKHAKLYNVALDEDQIKNLYKEHKIELSEDILIHIRRKPDHYVYLHGVIHEKVSSDPENPKSVQYLLEKLRSTENKKWRLPTLSEANSIITQYVYGSGKEEWGLGGFDAFSAAQYFHELTEAELETTETGEHILKDANTDCIILYENEERVVKARRIVRAPSDLAGSDLRSVILVRDETEEEKEARENK